MTVLAERRRFLGNVVAGAGTLALGSAGNWAFASNEEAPSWALPLLGDLHYDRLEHHDLDWLREHHPGDVSQVQNYTRISRDVTPRLLATVRDTLAAPSAAVPFVVQLGDLIEGLCGTEALARRQADDAVALIRSLRLPVPFLFTKGNHDITGPGAARVYDDVLVPFMAGSADSGIDRAAFSRQRHGVLLVFYDAYDRASLEWFEALLREHQPRRLLFFIHPPVVPYNARSTWHIYSQPRQQRQRERLLALLGQHRAIVLSGHLHKYSVLVRRTQTGRFVQVALSSVASSEDARVRDLREGRQDYGPDLVELEPRHSPDTVEQRRQVLEAEAPTIEHFEYADTWGRGLIKLHGDNVHVEVYRGLERRTWKTIDVTELLA